MEELEDDFGELYANIEVQVKSSTIDTTIHYNEDEERVNLDSISIEEGEQEKLQREEDEKLMISENESDDSEDDLRIVLNEEDCRVNTVSRGVNGGGGSCEDEEDDILFGTETAAVDKDKKRSDKLQLLNDGVEHKFSGFGAERGNAGMKKGNYYSQYKYIRAHGAAFGCNQQQGSSLATSPSFGSTSFLPTGQTGCDFSLPRYRTILDVNIDAFEHKPWKHPGVDITDFFNFGLDEESWKHYCNCLVYGAGFGRQTGALENVSAESAQNGEHGRFSMVLNDTDRVRSLDIPKGRQIQVEGSIGERQPSMDIRRPQNRDSDVVIQISVDDKNECLEEQYHSDNSKNGSFGMDLSEHVFSAESMDENRSQFHEAYVKDVGSWSLKRHSELKTTSERLVEHLDGQGNEEILDANGFHLQKAKDSVKADPCTLELESSLGDQIQYTSSLSYSDSHIQASSVDAGSAKENIHKPARKKSSNLASGLLLPLTMGCNQSNYSESNDGKSEGGDDRYYSQSRSIVRGEQDSSSKVRLCNVAKRKNYVDGADPTTIVNRHGDNNLTRNTSKRKQRQYENDFYDEEDFSYYRETEISFCYRSERSAAKPVIDAYNETFRGKGDTKVRNETDQFIKRHWDERDYFHEERYTLRDDEARNREHLLPEGRYSNRKLHCATHQFTQLTPEPSFYTEKDQYRWQRRKKNDKECFKREREDEDFVLEHRAQEDYIQEKCARPIPHYGRGKEFFNENYYERVSYKIPDRRDIYGGSPCKDIMINSGRDVVHDDEYWKPAYDSLSPHREFQITYGRAWQDTISPSPVVYDSRRSDRSDMIWKRIHCEKHQNDNGYNRRYRDSRGADRVIYPDDYFCSEERGDNHEPKAFDWPEDRVRSRGWNQGRIYLEEAPFSYEGSSRHAAIHGKRKDSIHGRKAFDEYLQLHDKNRMIREETRDLVGNTRIASRTDTVDEDEQTSVRHRKSLDLHLGCGKGKASRRCSTAGNARCKDSKMADKSMDKEHTPSVNSNKLSVQKVTLSNISKVENNFIRRTNLQIKKVNDFGFDFEPPRIDKYSNRKQCETLVLQEGQSHVDDERKEFNPPERNWHLDKPTRSGVTSDKQKHLHNTVNGNKVVGGYANRRILETLAKMERRRDRFKEPIALKEPDKTPKPQPDSVVESTESMHQRPTRNPGKSGIGGVISNERGQCCAGFSLYLGISTNNIAESQALYHGVMLANSLNILKLIIQVDSQLDQSDDELLEDEINFEAMQHWIEEFLTSEDGEGVSGCKPASG
ncbi:Fip1 [Thalictrum thalictroides]|uniref:Fip1 n=1 Tax=Thalictrum thalictroides TaxID=46969 RepID=A0A7J6VH83_THATH|nr:Fip1 [Thalictrum thalictroides]